MGLKAGSLRSLILDDISCPNITSVPPHMLQALDCLEINGIIHRDVKPENIREQTASICSSLEILASRTVPSLRKAGLVPPYSWLQKCFFMVHRRTK